MKSNTDRFFIVTGGPGSGKTSLLDALEKMNHKRSVEAGRGIIRQQVAIGGRALPWDDKVLFSELMLSWEIRSYHIAEQWAGIVFFDRGVPDIAAYLTLSNLPIPKYVQKAIETFHYNPRVFIAPPWREIFTQDRERKQDFDEAIRTYESLAKTYTGNGYKLVELPCVSIQERVRFVLASSGAYMSSVLALPGTAVHAHLGHIAWIVMALVAAGAIPFAHLGAKLAIKARAAKLGRWYRPILTGLGIFFLYQR